MRALRRSRSAACFAVVVISRFPASYRDPLVPQNASREKSGIRAVRRSTPIDPAAGATSTDLPTGSIVRFPGFPDMEEHQEAFHWGISVTDLEIDEAIREAWTIQHGGSATSPSARRLAAALLAVTGGTPSHWVIPDDLWRDRLAVLAEQGAWLTAWGPRPGEPDCRVPPALLPERQTRRESAYFLWRSLTRVSTDVDSESKAARKSRTHRQDDAEQTGPARPKTRRRKSPAPDGVQD